MPDDGYYLETECDPTWITASTKVVIDPFISLHRGGEVVASASAEIDLADVPKEYHEIMVQLMLRSGQRVHLPVYQKDQPKPAVEERPSLWRRVLNRLT